MILLPAIDLMSGEVVRLQQGKADQKTVYSNDPAAFARRWEEEGGDYLHIVDLDATRLKSDMEVSKSKSQEVNYSTNQNVILPIYIW